MPTEIMVQEALDDVKNGNNDGLPTDPLYLKVDTRNESRQNVT